MPTTSPQVKWTRCAAWAARWAGESFSDAYAHAQVLEKKEKLTFVIRSTIPT